ncbi:MAG: 7-carboxy-7-deazaguanine synthase QueE [Candidatus Omnitrophica bacterium]|nr:7-carboxy-7-deazaguanine synthase QueE [Candidatus Omnitrophota bacterium]
MNCDKILYMLEICEIFSSIQGEGFNQGRACVFIRCARCNLRCKFCDTRYSWKKGKTVDEETIVRKIEKFNIKSVIITGGEPLLQDLRRVISLLTNKGYKIAVETNGLTYQNLNVDWLTVSPKKAGTRRFKNGYDERFRKTASEFKYVICDMEDINFIDRKIKVPVILQPVDNELKLAEKIAKEMEKIKIPNWFLRLQLHKLLKIQ